MSEPYTSKCLTTIRNKILQEGVIEPLLFSYSEVTFLFVWLTIVSQLVHTKSTALSETPDHELFPMTYNRLDAFLASFSHVPAAPVVTC